MLQNAGKISLLINRHFIMEQAEKDPDMRMMEAAGILSDQTAFKDATDYGIDFDHPVYRLT
jgi:hypothetical protein